MASVNIGLALEYLFPDAQPNHDYVVIADGENMWIDQWNMKEPKPTDQELEAAYKEYMKNPPVKSSPSETLTEVQQINSGLIKQNQEFQITAEKTLETLNETQKLNADLIFMLSKKGLL